MSYEIFDFNDIIIINLLEVGLMNFDCLNEMIKYIEDNLDSQIDFNKLSKITNINLFILERIFMFLTDMTINEYIKKRRLSRAFEEIRNTNCKIIDIAFKYQYNSASSFNRAFKNLFNMTPTECRKSTCNYKVIPIEYFENDQERYDFDYEIKKVPHTILYCYHVTSDTHSDLLYKIKQLYIKTKNNGYYKKFNAAGMYGIFFYDGELYHYYLGTSKCFSDLEKYEIKEEKFAVFKFLSRQQKEIVRFEGKINSQWIPSTNYNAKTDLKVELYKEGYCYIYLPIE